MNIIEFTEKYNVFYDGKEWHHGITLQSYEREFLNELSNNRFTLSLASRQMHMTTLLSCYVAYCILFNKEERMAYISPKLDTSCNFISKVKMIIDNYIELSSSKIKTIIHNKKSIKLSNNNKITGFSPSATGFCGYTITQGLIDNPEHIDNLLSLLTSALVGSLSTNGSIHMVGSPKITDMNEFNYFEVLWTSNDSLYKRNTYHYSRNTKYTPERIDNIKTMLGSYSFNSEMELMFVKTQKIKDKIIQTRVNNDLSNKVGMRLIELDISLSDYIRNLIIKDLNEG